MSIEVMSGETMVGKGSRTFGDIMEKRMREMGLTYRDVEKATGKNYEHVRKMRHAMAFPSQEFLEQLCDVLKLDVKEMSEIILKDKIQQKYNFKTMAGNVGDPALMHVWNQLTVDQRELIMAQMKVMVSRNPVASRHIAKKRARRG
jgi:transcriptional regulator with XRE-family HTH domain